MEQNRDLTNRNRIGGSSGRTSGQATTKSRSIKGLCCKSGRCAAKAVELTPGGLHRVPDSGLRMPQGVLIAAQKSAEGIVPVSGMNCGRGRPERCGVASRTRTIMARKRQKIQLELAFMTEERGEAPKAVREGIERAVARGESERPAVSEEFPMAHNPPNRRGTDPYARWCGRGEPRGFSLSRFCWPPLSHAFLGASFAD